MPKNHGKWKNRTVVLTGCFFSFVTGSPALPGIVMSALSALLRAHRVRRVSPVGTLYLVTQTF